MPNFNVITGATGLLGSHIAEQLRADGKRVRAVVRSTSGVTFLNQLGVEISTGSLHDEAFLQTAFAGADTVFHCASRVGDFGTWKQFQAEIVETTRNVMVASKSVGVPRVVHVSSVAVYGLRPRIPPRGLTEDHPLPRRRVGDRYGKAKLQAEMVARDAFPDVTIIRPTWIFGPRDRHGLTRLLTALRGRWVSLVGSGDNLLNIVHAADVAAGAILAAKCDVARGETYNLCSEGEITQRQFLDAICAAEGLPPIDRHVSLRLAYFGGFLGDMIARLLRLRRAPLISRYSVSRLGRPALYRIDKARSELNWQPRVRVLEALKPTLDWIRQDQCR